MWLGKPDMECSWVRSDLVPKQVIDEYKKGGIANVVFKSTVSHQQETVIATIEQSSDGMYMYIMYVGSVFNTLYIVTNCVCSNVATQQS